MPTDPLTTPFHQIAATLGPNRRYRFEWSLRLCPDQVAVRDKAICWLDTAGTPPDDDRVAAFDTLLQTLECPQAIRATRETLSRRCLHQGLGFSVSGARDYGLYLHHQSLPSYRDHYEAYHWPAGPAPLGGPDARYTFYFFPETPHGERPETWIHPALLTLYDTLASHALLQALSGFWVRDSAGVVDQICLTFPWLPAVHTYLETLSSFVTAPMARRVLERYAAHHFRHLTFTTTHATAPALTLYFAGASATVPPDMQALQASVRRDAQHLSQALRVYLPDAVPQPAPPTPARLDHFYSPPNIEVWQQALGKNLHYHFGIFTPEDDVRDIWSERPFERAVTELLPFIPQHAKVYDMGCGWGGTARYLAQEHGCDVTGITASRAQYRYCDALGVKCRYGMVESTLPPGRFDVLLLLESLEHVRDKAGLLKTLRLFGDRLILRTHCQDSDADALVFNGTMHLISTQELAALLHASGWTIQHWRNRRAVSMPTVAIWHQRLRTIPPQPEEHFEAWRRFCQNILRHPEAWAQYHPLIEVVAT